MVEAVESKEGYRETELGLLPSNWEIKNMNEICIAHGIIRGPFGGSLKKDDFVRNGIKVYGQGNAIYKNLKKGHYYINEDKFNQLSRFEVKENDFIVSCSGTIGEIYRIPSIFEKGIINQALLKLSINIKKINTDYFYIYFKWNKFRNSLIDNTQGGAMKNLVGMPVFKKIVMVLPPIKEQKAITTVLSDMDGLIESLEKVIDKKQRIKQGTMQSLLTGKKRLPGFSREWIEDNVEGFGFTTRGRVISRNEINKSINNAYPVYSSQTTNNGVMGYIDTYDFEGDFITWTTDGANAGRVFYRNGKFNCTNVCGVISLKRHEYQFISLALNRVTRNYVSTNLANPKLMNDVMKKITIKVPKSIKEQQAIATILLDMDTEIELLEKKLEKYEQMKEGMMQQLLTGRIRLV